MQRLTSGTSSAAAPIPTSISQAPEEFEPSVVREKENARGSWSTTYEASQSSSSSSTILIDSPLSAVQKPQIDVPKVLVKFENANIFAEMFAKDKSKLRTFSWQHFVQAMVDAGCSVTQGSGSTVTFGTGTRTIVFHQPHPEPKIDPVMLTFMGKRLRKWFGWDWDTFAVREEEDTKK